MKNCTRSLLLDGRREEILFDSARRLFFSPKKKKKKKKKKKTCFSLLFRCQIFSSYRNTSAKKRSHCSIYVFNLLKKITSKKLEQNNHKIIMFTSLFVWRCMCSILFIFMPYNIVHCENSESSENIVPVGDVIQQPEPREINLLVNTNPTFAPSPVPTQLPTYRPSNPSQKPSAKPSNPSHSPTKAPQYAPTYKPTPSTAPTPEPSTLKPTVRPTREPTWKPSSSPTISPTPRPTHEPSTKPSLVRIVASHLIFTHLSVM